MATGYRMNYSVILLLSNLLLFFAKRKGTGKRNVNPSDCWTWKFQYTYKILMSGGSIGVIQYLSPFCLLVVMLA